MGRMASGIEIPYEGEDYCALKDVPPGELRIKQYYSTVLNKWRQFYVYAPTGYDIKLNEEFPVLYILHGGGEDERGWATQGKTNVILDNLIAAGKARPMLVVMPDGNVGVPGFGENRLKIFEAELKQYKAYGDQRFRIVSVYAAELDFGLARGGIPRSLLNRVQSPTYTQPCRTSRSGERRLTFHACLSIFSASHAEVAKLADAPS